MAAAAALPSTGNPLPPTAPAASPSKSWKEDAKTTAFALAMLALFFGGAALLGYGLSSLPSVRITGFGFMYQLAAYHFTMLGCILLAGSAIMATSVALSPSDDTLRVATKV